MSCTSFRAAPSPYSPPLFPLPLIPCHIRCLRQSTQGMFICLYHAVITPLLPLRLRGPYFYDGVSACNICASCFCRTMIIRASSSRSSFKKYSKNGQPREGKNAHASRGIFWPHWIFLIAVKPVSFFKRWRICSATSLRLPHFLASLRYQWH